MLTISIDHQSFWDSTAPNPNLLASVSKINDLSKLAKSQHRGLWMSFLKCLKGVFGFLACSSYWHIPQIDVCFKGCMICTKTFDELPIVPHQDQKGADVCASLGWDKFHHNFQVLFAGSHTLSGDVMSQIVNLILEEFALCGFSFRLCSQKQLNTTGQALQVLLLCL